MRELTKTLLLLAVGIIGGMLLFKFTCAPDQNLDKLRREIEQVRRQNDSLEAINRLAEARIDSLRQRDIRKRELADSLEKEIQSKTKVITKIVRDLNVYKGTPTDLLRELNEFVRSPLPPFPDTSITR
ncbi:MAG: hypothetical protein ONB44_06575 [candidate division KSB1 bacterium]|nr:hypothetical protein [candidate division KSB1 bacterium]MDZ7301788.1 hypothetical protein [candidate division KSB1 bacterium]MDZ7311433.1 hypothetical protein [candidate division KSB1 bacterium]